MNKDWDGHERREKRQLADSDIDAIIDRFMVRFKLNLGDGVLAFVWRGIIVALIGLAAYGAMHGGHSN